MLIVGVGVATLVLVPLVWGLIRRTTGLPMFGAPTVAQLEDPSYRPGIVGMKRQPPELSRSGGRIGRPLSFRACPGPGRSIPRLAIVPDPDSCVRPGSTDRPRRRPSSSGSRLTYSGHSVSSSTSSLPAAASSTVVR